MGNERFIPPIRIPKKRRADRYGVRILSRIQTLLEAGLDEHQIAVALEIEVETLLSWACGHADLKELFDNREQYRRWDEVRNLRIAEMLAERGASETEIAYAFNVSARTLANWRLEYPAFDEALTQGQEKLVKVAERSLFRMATGFLYEEERTVSTDAGLQKIREQKVRLPSAQAAATFLAANNPEKYGTKVNFVNGEDPLDEFLTELAVRGCGSVAPIEKDGG